MVNGLGTDIIEVQRIANSIERHGNRFLERLFTQEEINYCSKFRDFARHYAGRFAAKEAIVKALGTGISHEISWLDMEILNDERGKPFLNLSLKGKDLFGNPEIQLSISHCKEYAMAVALVSRVKYPIQSDSKKLEKLG